MMRQVHPTAMKPQIAFLGSAAAGSRFSGKVIVPGFRFSAAGFSFRTIVLRDAHCCIPLTRS